MKRLAREGLSVGVGQGLVVLGRLVTLWCLTRFLDQGVFGQIALIQGVAALGFSVLCGPFFQAALRFHATALTEGREQALMSFMRPLVMRSAWITTVALVIGTLVWRAAAGSSVSPWALVAGLAVIVPDAARSYELTVFNATRRQAAYVVWNVADALARPLGAAAAVGLFGRSAVSVLFGFFVAVVLVNQVCSRLLVSAPPDVEAEPMPPETRKWIIRFATPLMALAVMSWIVSVADRYVLAAIGGVGAAGLYAAIYGLGSQGFVSLGQVGLTIFRPMYFLAVDAHDARRGRRVLGLWLAVMAAGSAAGVTALVVFGRPLARLCLGPDFRGAASLLPWIGAAYALQTLQTVFEVLLYTKHRTTPLLYVQIAGAITALVLYAILIPRYGAFGAVLATTAAFAVSCVLAATLGDLMGALRRTRQ